MSRAWSTLGLMVTLGGVAMAAEGPSGYYRTPALHGRTLVFAAEGDLWRVPLEGGVAERITSHPRQESDPAISPDGTTLAFTGRYEGPAEVYTMPLSGGLPIRRTWGGGTTRGWTPDGRVVIATTRRAGLPNEELAILDLATGVETPVPLAQASEGVFDADGHLYFARLEENFSHTKRYRGGAAQSIWTWRSDGEASRLTREEDGVNRWPLIHGGRLYVTSDRDGTMNLWSMTTEGSDPRQHTRHRGWDLRTPCVSEGRVVYQLGADLRVLDLASGEDAVIPITLRSDLDQIREHWIDAPIEYVTSVRLSPDGKRIALTARGQVFVAPVGEGRLVEAPRRAGVRYRAARFLPGGTSLLLMSDESGEVEFSRLPADGTGAPTRITRDGHVLRTEGVPSPDGRWLAATDKNGELWLYDLDSGQGRMLESNPWDTLYDLRFSPDSRWLAYTAGTDNLLSEIRIREVGSDRVLRATSDRWISSDAVFDPKGKWLYFLSDRHLESVVGNPWGARHPEPFFDRATEIYALALTEGLRSPFLPEDELTAPSSEEKEDTTQAVPKVLIDEKGLPLRLTRVPAPPGNYSALSVNAERLYLLDRSAGEDTARLLAVPIGTDALEDGSLEPLVLTDAVTSYELSADGKKLLIRKDRDLYVLDASAEADADLADAGVDLSGWSFALDPREEWRQMFVEAWRLERDYFYDRGMVGVDWPAVRDKYLPLVDRLTCREDLSDLLGEMIGELATLHMYVYGGERRKAKDDIAVASLGAELELDPARGGWSVRHVYRSDPDDPERLSPLARPGVEVSPGDLIVTINGADPSHAASAGALLRNQAGKQVRLKVRPARGPERDVIVVPLSADDARDLRYREWEYTRRLRVEEASANEIGYLHLRAMGAEDMAVFARDFYPLWNRKGIIIDVRNNNGGNIDSWILNRLIRPAWMWWQPRVGRPYPNMQAAYGGHLVVLCNEWTISDGEAFAEGFRRLGLGKVIGTRTWGGEVWLTSSNFLADGGIATAAEFGVYGPEGRWLIEGHGVDPDIVVDNLPHATWNGEDAQLEAAIRHLEQRIAEDPIVTPPPPPYPDLSRP